MANIFVFAFDLTEASQVRRIKNLQTLGHDIQSAAFRRGNMNADFSPDWPNIDLGFVENEQLGKRLVSILRGVLRMTRHRDALKEADVIMARNFDLLIIAWMSRVLSGAWRVPLVYECLDIHGLLTKTGPVGAMMRWCERRLLARVKLLIVSSPGFITHYFRAIQGYQGPYSIIENKLWFDATPIARPKQRPQKADDVLTLGWVGSIRCGSSLRLLMEAADALPERIRIRVHGNVHRHALPAFDAEVAKHPNVICFGPYEYPTELAEVYANCDLVWAQDLWQRGANSDWLLPNRIYEASWFGCPSIAVADTETGRRVAAGHLGFTVADTKAKSLIDLLKGLDRGAITRVSDHLLATDGDEFMLRPNDLQTALISVLPANR
ncbi:glycosyl transferase [Octadecabacter sp. G9-8]|uniref:Glycosyl transferase n=1 Tax=Octadecabacter dasysiphoniae TaxID=2909341 RepID=A0ABS9CU09_9RHOB|nr:glycosyltransferase [Octadecabacter dasysiphoniae]MCF2870431.1 glycosyl transferase [Octadecabacter dasysiphoniae]